MQPKQSKLLLTNRVNVDTGINTSSISQIEVGIERFEQKLVGQGDQRGIKRNIILNEMWKYRDTKEGKGAKCKNERTKPNPNQS